MDFLIWLAAWVGLVLLIRRMGATGEAQVEDAVVPASYSANFPLVSIVVPARNEAGNLPRLLASLNKLSYPAREVIVIDDQSTDGTAEIARQHGAKVIAGTPPPTDWRGKQWACAQGARAAQGEILLFTDADTEHFPSSLERAVEFLNRRQLDMMSCLPYHRCQELWEKLMGPFHFMLLSTTNPYGRPAPGKVYAIGQYLMFRRSFYDEIGGHGAVRGEMVEDLPLANVCLLADKKYGVYGAAPLFEVRMYETLGDFIKGWRRNFRAGMTGSRKAAVVEMFLVIAAMTGGGHPFRSIWWFLPAGLSAIFLWMRQSRLGNFSPWGPVLSCWSVAIFCYVSVLAAMDQTLGRSLVWKGRAYK